MSDKRATEKGHAEKAPGRAVEQKAKAHEERHPAADPKAKAAATAAKGDSKGEIEGHAKQDAMKEIFKKTPAWALDKFTVVNANQKFVDHPAFPNAKIAPLHTSDQGYTRAVVKYVGGNTEPPHSHGSDSELYVISGKFRVTDPTTREAAQLEPGSYIYCPAHKVSSLECLETGEFIALLRGKPDYIPYVPAPQRG